MTILNRNWMQEELIPEIVGDDESLDKCPEGVSPDVWKVYADEEKAKQDQFLWTLKRGIAGHNVGLGNGLNTINKYIHGTHKARYYLIGAESGVGKTTLGDFMFVHNLWQSAKDAGRRVRIQYLSFEIGKTDKIYRWCSYYIWKKHGIKLPSDYLQGQVAGISPGQHRNLILEAYSHIQEMMKDVVIIEHVLNPTTIFNGLVEQWFEKNGTVERDPVSAEDAKKGKRGFIRSYRENDADLMTILYIDHMALTGTEMGLDTKGIMDKLSKYIIVLRNMFHCTAVVIQQFSADMLNTYRAQYGKKKEEADIKPGRNDFGESKAPFRDADVVLAGTKPKTHDFASYFTYNVMASDKDGIGDYFIVLFIIKNRYGPSDRRFALFMDYITGDVYDLPPPNEPDKLLPFVQLAKQLDAICSQYSPKVP